MMEKKKTVYQLRISKKIKPSSYSVRRENTPDDNVIKTQKRHLEAAYKKKIQRRNTTRRDLMMKSLVGRECLLNLVPTSRMSCSEELSMRRRVPAAPPSPGPSSAATLRLSPEIARLCRWRSANSSPSEITKLQPKLQLSTNSSPISNYAYCLLLSFESVFKKMFLEANR